MPLPDNAADAIYRHADRAAGQFCRKHADPIIEYDDIRQDLLLDLLTRVPNHDLTRSSFGTFAAICFRHRSARLALNIHRHRRSRHPRALDAPVPGQDTVLHDTLSEDDGYAAWVGQPTNRSATLDRRLDLDRIITALPAELITLCAVLMSDTADPARAAGLPRTTRHRRIRELRCRLLAAGIGTHVEQTAATVGI